MISPHYRSERHDKRPRPALARLNLIFHSAPFGAFCQVSGYGVRHFFLSALLIPILASAADQIDIKTGLWETTITPEKGVGLPIAPETLSHFSGSQRESVESQIRRSASQNLKPRTIRRCVTEKTYAPGKLVEQRHTDQLCTRNVTVASTTQLEIHMECAGPRTVTMIFHLESRDPTLMTGTAHLTISDKARSPIVSDSTLVSRWLSSDCGAIKPPAGE